MRIKDIKSLIWLTRWYNGRSQRLSDLHQTHLATVFQMVMDELGGTSRENAELELYGFKLVVSTSPDGLVVKSISPPTFLNGLQLMLFDTDFEDDDLAEQYCESLQGGQRGVAV